MKGVKNAQYHFGEDTKQSICGENACEIRITCFSPYVDKNRTMFLLETKMYKYVYLPQMLSAKEHGQGIEQLPL